MKQFDKEKVKEALTAVDKVCLHCEKCDKGKCSVYNTYGQLEKIK